jgi:phosphate-selective porin
VQRAPRLRADTTLVNTGTRHLLALALALACGGALAPPAWAQDGSPREGGRGVTWDKRPTIVFGDGSQVDLHARVQTDYVMRNEADPDGSALTFDDRLSVERKRVGIEGVLFDRVAFQVEGELGDSQPWRDVFADFKVNRALRIRAGRFKVPFSLEQLTGGTDLDFIARAAAVTDLAPSRDAGVMVHGRLLRRAVKYETGVFEVDAADRVWARAARRALAGRITVAPLADGGSRGSDTLEFAAALLRTDLPEAGRNSPSGHLVMGDRFFRRMYVNGARTHLGASAAWNGRRASLSGELIRVLDARLGQAVDDGDLPPLRSTGGYVAGIWHLAARDGRRYGRAPLRALDLTARFDRLSFGSAGEGEGFLNPRADHVATIGRNAWTAGLNWAPNRWTKLQVNAVREQLVDPQALLPLATDPRWSTVLRFQVAM